MEDILKKLFGVFLFLRVFALISLSPIFHFKYFISKSIASLFLTVGVTVMLLLESLSSFVWICDWNKLLERKKN